MDSSFSLWLAKSYSTLACILALAGGAAGGGGGGGARAEDVEPWLRVWLGRVVVAAAGVAAAAGVGTGRGACSAAGPRFAVDDEAGFVECCTRAGLPPGPPGLMSLPRVMGLGGTGLPLGVG